jgi:transglutaminase-like putative cysteine protease
MEDALQETRYANIRHPILRAVAAKLKANGEDPVAIAIRTFYFVRDNIRFGFDLYDRQASEVLEKEYAVCWGKALLLTSLLRCNQIPARFGSIPVKNSFIAPAIGRWSVLGNNPFNHCMVFAWLNDRWTILDAVLDQRTYNTFFAPAGVTWGIDWNGQDDVHLYNESVMGPPVQHLDLDAAICSKAWNFELPKLLALSGYWLVNRRIRKALTLAMPNR